MSIQAKADAPVCEQRQTFGVTVAGSPLCTYRLATSAATSQVDADGTAVPRTTISAPAPLKSCVAVHVFATSVCATVVSRESTGATPDPLLVISLAVPCTLISASRAMAAGTSPSTIVPHAGAAETAPVPV